MDSLTHIVLGACIGEAFAGKKLGRKAMVWGALSQSIPDIDFVTAFWMSPADGLLAHRGFTHSFLFGIAISFLLALIAERWHRPHNISLRNWIFFFAGQVFSHLLIDACNSYGVGWFIPFSSYRVSFNILFVADPFFSVWPALAAFFLFIFRKNDSRRKFLWRTGIALPILYVGYALVNKMTIDTDVRRSFAIQKIPHARYFTTPSPLNNWLWFVVAEADSGFNVGFRSVFDKSPTTEFRFFPRNEELLQPLKGHEDLQHLIRFSKGYYTAEYWGDTLVFNDLRFGQIIGWQDPGEKFVFHFFIRQPAANRLVVQRGRFAKWNWEIVKSMVRRIRGR